MRPLIYAALALASCQTTKGKMSAKIRGADDAALADADFSKPELQAVADTIAAAKKLGEPTQTLACLKAKVDLAGGGAGTFKKAKSYDASVRVFSGKSDQDDDRAPRLDRGWAVKLLGVNHDFLFSTSPDFYIKDLTHYPAFLQATGEGRFGFAGNKLAGLAFDEQRVVMRRLVQKIPDLLAVPLYSALPYRYGDDVVKYALAPCGQPPPPYPKAAALPPNAGARYLQEAIARKNGACYTFFIQRQRSPAQDPSEDPTHEWTGPFEKVGQIALAAAPQPLSACDPAAFDPWHAPADNAPIGKVNLFRRALNRHRGLASSPETK